MKKLLVLQQDESDSAWDVTGQSPVVVVVKGDRSVCEGCVCVSSDRIQRSKSTCFGHTARALAVLWNSISTTTTRLSLLIFIMSNITKNHETV